MDETDLFIIKKLIVNSRLTYRELVLENGAYDLVKDYSNDFIELIVNKRKRKKKKFNY